MGFFFLAKNHMEDLGADLCQRLRPRPEDSVFDRDIVVVSAKGVEQWLRFQVAEGNGICANVEFLLLQKFATRYLFPAIPPPVEEGREGVRDQAGASDPGVLAWRIYGELKEGGGDYAELHDFIQAESSTQAARRFSLATQVAALFDQYAVYRPDKVLRWQRGEEQGWQPALWRRLFPTEAPPHAASLCQQFINGLGQAAARDRFLRQFPRRRVFFFGFSSMPPVYFTTLQATGEASGLDVFFYYLSPCNGYWSESSSPKQALRELTALEMRYGPPESQPEQPGDNPLLGSLGRIGREFTKVALDHNADTTGSAFEADQPPATRLQWLQRDILEGKDCTVGHGDQELGEDVLSSRGLPADASISFHSCHSPRREVEVLREALLKFFAETPGALPRDIIVMVADMAGYAPYIHAVFGGGAPGASGGRQWIPYSIADRSEKEEYPELAAFLKLLAIGRTRLTSEDLLGLLETPAVRRRFGLADDDYARLLPLLREAGAAWGRDREFRKKETGVAFHEYSWRFAFERLMLGYAMVAGEVPGEALFEGPAAEGLGIAPLARGTQTARTVAAFMDFAERIFELHWQLSGGEVPTDWGTFLYGLLESFFADEEEFADGRRAIRSAIALLEEQLEAARLQETLPPEVVEAWMDKALQGETVRGKFLAGGVTFCKFQPMRGIPAGMIAMLGLNDGVFPRQDPLVSFSLLGGNQRRSCDRSLKDDDRYAFLEALLAARRRIHISFVGKDARDNKQIPPSIVVGELLEYLQGRFSQAGGRGWILEHPLHPFSPRYFTAGTPLVSYARSDFEVCLEMRRPAEAPRGRKPVASFTPPESLELETLAKFFASPCQAWLDRLGIRSRRRPGELPDTVEPFAVDNLGVWKIREWLGTAIEAEPQVYQAPETRGPAVARLYRATAARALLPLEPEGRSLFDQCLGDVLARKQGLDQATAGMAGCEIPEAEKRVEITVGDGRGGPAVTMTLLFPGARLLEKHGSFYAVPSLASSGKSRGGLQALLLHLAWCASGRPVTTRRLQKDEKKGYAAVDIAPFDPGTARQELATWLGLYLQGQSSPLCFWLPAIQAAADKEGDPRKKWLAARQKWEQDDGGRNFEAVDDATAKCFGPRMPDLEGEAGQEFLKMAAALGRSFAALEPAKGEPA